MNGLKMHNNRQQSAYSCRICMWRPDALRLLYIVEWNIYVQIQVRSFTSQTVLGLIAGIMIMCFCIQRAPSLPVVRFRYPQQKPSFNPVASRRALQKTQNKGLLSNQDAFRPAQKKTQTKIIDWT